MMTYGEALFIAAAFYAILTAGATWLCVFIFDPLVPLRRDKKARRYVVIGFALLCFFMGYGIASAEIVDGTLAVYYRPAQCDPNGDLSRCTPEIYETWMSRASQLQDAFWGWMMMPPMLRPYCGTVSHVVCDITGNRAYGNPMVWYTAALMRGAVMAATALIVGLMLTRAPKRKLTMEEEALMSLRVTKKTVPIAKRLSR